MLHHLGAGHEKNSTLVRYNEKIEYKTIPSETYSRRGCNSASLTAHETIISFYVGKAANGRRPSVLKFFSTAKSSGINGQPHFKSADSYCKLCSTP